MDSIICLEISTHETESDTYTIRKKPLRNMEFHRKTCTGSCIVASQVCLYMGQISPGP